MMLKRLLDCVLAIQLSLAPQFVKAETTDESTSRLMENPLILAELESAFDEKCKGSTSTKLEAPVQIQASVGRGAKKQEISSCRAIKSEIDRRKTVGGGGQNSCQQSAIDFKEAKRDKDEKCAKVGGCGISSKFADCQSALSADSNTLDAESIIQQCPQLSGMSYEELRQESKDLQEKILDYEEQVNENNRRTPDIKKSAKDSETSLRRQLTDQMDRARKTLEEVAESDTQNRKALREQVKELKALIRERTLSLETKPTDQTAESISKFEEIQAQARQQCLEVGLKAAQIKQQYFERKQGRFHQQDLLNMARMGGLGKILESEANAKYRACLAQREGAFGQLDQALERELENIQRQAKSEAEQIDELKKELYEIQKESFESSGRETGNAYSQYLSELEQASLIQAEIASAKESANEEQQLIAEENARLQQKIQEANAEAVAIAKRLKTAKKAGGELRSKSDISPSDWNAAEAAVEAFGDTLNAYKEACCDRNYKLRTEFSGTGVVNYCGSLRSSQRELGIVDTTASED